MKTLTILLTSFVLLTSCGNKNEISCSNSEVTSNAYGCACQLHTKKNQVNQEFKRSKDGLIIISPKVGSLY